MRKFNIKVDGVMHEVEVEEIGATTFSNANVPISNVHDNVVTSNKNQLPAGTNSVVAPLEGTIQEVKVKVGDVVNKGDVVAIIEAMKMENDIPASSSGKVQSISVNKGTKVALGDVILTIA